MSQRFDCTDPAQLAEGLQEAQAALRRGELVVLPTDTVYGIAAEAFDPVAVDRLLAAKGRGRDMPPPVLVGTVRAAIALVQELGEMGKDLIDEFWPGGLTLIFTVQPHPGLGYRRDQGHGRGPDAAARGRPRPAQEDRPAGGEQRQLFRAAACHHRRRGGEQLGEAWRSTWTAGPARATCRPRSWT